VILLIIVIISVTQAQAK